MSAQTLEEQPKPEEWKLPDGRQMTYQALQAMGCTSGDVGERMREFYFDPDPNAFQNFSLKGVEVIEEHKVGSANQTIFDEKRHEQQKIDDDKRLEDNRLAEDRRIDDKREQEQWQAKKDAEEAMAAKNRPQEDAANRSIMGLPLGLATFGLGLGLTAGALSNVGDRFGGAAGAANDPSMVASNNGGGMFASLRGLMGMPGPGAGNDFLLKGPNQTMAFTPGVAPEMGESGPMAPAAPGNRNQMAMGMGMPGMTPRMGA